MKPMRLTDVEYSTASKYIEDDDWVLEQKFDGARLHVTARWLYNAKQYAIEWRASNGEPMKFAAAKQHLQKLEEQLTDLLAENGVIYAELDGELIIESGIYYLFDMPALTAENFVTVVPTTPYDMRRIALVQFMKPADGIDIELVFQARFEEDKRKFWSEINAANVEGAVAKHVNATYEYGTRSTQMVKLKLVKTADVIVTTAERKFKPGTQVVSHGNASLAVKIEMGQDEKPYVNSKGKRITPREYYFMKAGKRKDDFKLRHRTELPVGAASLIGKDLTIEPGDVVEVAYLYFTGEAMVQPRIMRKRRAEEKTPEQCTLDQFPEYSRKVV